jgi:hypothetical protein
MLIWANVTLWHMSTICIPFPSQLMSNFLSVQIVYHWFLTWFALCDVDLCFSLMLIRETNAAEKVTRWAKWLYHQHNQSIHMTDGMTVTSLSASLLSKISAAKDLVCRIVLNGILLCRFKKWCKFSSHIKVKLRKMKYHETRPTCVLHCVIWGLWFWSHYSGVKLALLFSPVWYLDLFFPKKQIGNQKASQILGWLPLYLSQKNGKGWQDCDL